MFVDEHRRHADERLGFLAEEAGRDDLFLEHRRLGPRQRVRPRVAREQGRGDHVHPRVGGLRRQDRGDQQLEWIAVVQFRVGVRVLLGEPLDDPARGRRRLQ
jgi:hypothetical protein